MLKNLLIPRPAQPALLFAKRSGWLYILIRYQKKIMKWPCKNYGMKVGN